MDENEKCELLNSSIDIDYINKKLNNIIYFISNFEIKKTIFIFKKIYLTEKTTLSFEGINIDIMHKIENIESINEKGNNEPQKEKSEGGLLDNLINSIIHNVDLMCKNIKIRFFDKENKNIEYSFFIKDFKYKENENAQPIRTDEKIKYLFLHNKALFIEGILFKEKYEEKDDIFFNDSDKKLVLQNNILFYIKNKIEIDIFYNKDNNILTVGNNNNSEFYIESITNVQQLNSFLNFFIPQKDNQNFDININYNCENNLLNNDINEEEKENAKNEIIEVDINKKQKKNMDLMGFKIEKINVDFKIWLFYFILMNKNDKEKLWISHQENIINKKEMFISEDIIKHFNSYKEKYYIFCINNLFISTNNKEISLNEMLLQIIELQNEINNNVYDNEFKNIINISKLNLKDEEILYDNILIEINPYLFYFIKKFNLFENKKSFLKKIKKNKELNEDNNKIIVDDKIEEKNDYDKNDNYDIDNKIIINEINKDKKIILNGKNLNIKLFIDKNIEENIKKDISLNEIISNKEEKNDYLDFILTNLIINKEEKIVITYDKFNLTYNDTENKSYQLFKILEDKNIVQPGKNIIINYQKEISIDLQFVLLIFINPKITKNILNYYKFISPIFNIKQIKKNNNIYYNAYDDDYNNERVLSEKHKKNTYFKLKQLKIFIINEIENYLNIEKFCSNLPKINIGEKINNNYICININEIGGKLEYDNNNIKKLNAYLKQLIIEDGIMNSMYKVLLSNYNFKSKEDILINCDFEIQNNNNQYEIKPYIAISPIAIYLDKITLYYLFQTYYLIKDKKENQKEKEENKKEEKDISKNKIKNEKFIIYNSNIKSFFIQINYDNNKGVKDEEFLNIKFVKYLNSTSLKNLNIDFNEYKNEKDYFSINEAIKDIYEFYSSMIKNQMKSGYLVPALPVLNHLFSIIDGAFNIVREPIKKYNNKESVIDGFVIGINNFVVNTASVFTYLGEPLFNYLNYLGCNRKNDEDDDKNNNNFNFCKNLRYQINEKNKEIEEFYLK